jgi:uncharacterized SAM-binding protein YcdF (DUF218 family)
MIWIVSTSIILVVSAWMISGVGNWLVVSDAMTDADAIVALAGDVPFRSMEAARAYHEGWAKEVWLTRAVVGDRASLMAELGVELVETSDYDLQILEAMGVPAGSIKVLPGRVRSTADEVRAIERLLAETGGERVIIVTSPSHTRRTRTLWRRIVGDGAEVLLRPAEGAPYAGSAWWLNSTSIEVVVHELLGIMNAWLDSPVTP